MKNLMDIFTRPLTDHRSMYMPRRRPTTCTVPDDHPRAAELKEVALAYELSIRREPMGRRDACRLAAASLDMAQPRFDVLLAQHHIVTGRDDVLEVQDHMNDEMNTILMAAARLGRTGGGDTTLEDLATATGIQACDIRIALSMIRPLPIGPDARAH